MDVTYRCVLEFKMPEERHKVGYAINGHKYYAAVVRLCDTVKDMVKSNPSSELIELFDDCRGIAKDAGIEIY